MRSEGEKCACKVCSTSSALLQARNDFIEIPFYTITRNSSEVLRCFYVQLFYVAPLSTLFI